MKQNYVYFTHFSSEKFSMDANFFPRVERLAKQHGYTRIKDLLDECGLSASAFFNWKRGGPGGPSAEHVMRLAEKLHTSVEWLMNGTRPANSSDMQKISRLCDKMSEIIAEIKLLTDATQSP